VLKALLIFLVILIMSLLAFLSVSAEYQPGMLILGICALGFFGFLALDEARNETWIVSPLVAYFIASSMYVGLAPIWGYLCLIWGEAGIHQFGLLNIAEDIDLSTAYCFLGVAFFYLGFKVGHIGGTIRIARLIHRRSPDYYLSPNFWLTIIAGAWLLRFAPALVGSLRRIGHIYVHIIAFTSSGCFVVLTMRSAYMNGQLRILPTGRYLYLAVGLAMLDLSFVALKSGMRNPILSLLFIFLWGYVLQREVFLRSASQVQSVQAMFRPMVASLVAVFLVAAVIMPFGKKLASRQRDEVTEEEITAQFYEIRETFPFSGIWALPARLGRVSLHSLGACLQLYDFMDPPQTVVRGVLEGIVPRILWPDKPWVTKGSEFSIVLDVGGGTDETQATTATALTAIGELYWSYNVPGVIIGMFALGFLYGFAWLIFSHRFPLHPVRLHASVFMSAAALRWFEGEATSAFVGIIFIYVVFLPLISFDAFQVFGLKKKD